MPLTPVLTKRWLSPRSWTLETYEQLEGYQGLRKALTTMTAGRGHHGGQGLQPARPRRRRLPDRHEVAVHPAERRQAALRRGQRRRGRAGHLPGRAADDGRPALDDRGHRHRLATRCAANVAFIYIRGERCTPSAGCSTRSARRTRPATSARTSSAPASTCEMVVHCGAGAYICGEETALLDSLEGYRGQPRLKPPFPATNGLYDSPTVVNNVGTLASVPAIILGGADWWKTMGPERSPGTSIFSLSGRIDAARASTRRRWAPRCASCWRWPAASGPGKELKFWTPGGSSTPLFTAEHLDVPLDFDSVVKAGSMNGTQRAADLRRRRQRGLRGLQVDEVLRARVLRQVHAVPRGDVLDASQILRPDPGRRRAPPRTWTPCWTPATTSSAARSARSATARRARSPVSLQYFRDEYEDYIAGRIPPRLRQTELVGAH